MGYLRGPEGLGGLESLGGTRGPGGFEGQEVPRGSKGLGCSGERTSPIKLQNAT